MLKDLFLPQLTRLYLITETWNKNWSLIDITYQNVHNLYAQYVILVHVWQVNDRLDTQLPVTMFTWLVSHRIKGVHNYYITTTPVKYQLV